MLTFFAAPRAFEGKNGVVQRNAIVSWTKLKPECEIILLGEEAGIADFARDIGARHIPHIQCTPSGIPLLNSIFETAEKNAQSPYVGFINSDIILLSDFMKAFEFIRENRKRFLLTGQRWNCDVVGSVDFKKEGWEHNLRQASARKAVLEPPYAMDYFIYPRGVIRDQPAMTIARGYSDNWMIYRARASKADVIDATPCILAIHQTAGLPESAIQKFHGTEELQKNRELAFQQMKRYYSLLDATHMLGRSKSGYVLLDSSLQNQDRHMSLSDRQELFKKLSADVADDDREMNHQLLATTFWYRAQEDWRKEHDLSGALINGLKAFRWKPGVFSPLRIIKAGWKNLREALGTFN